jgi:hypothetical protein
MLAVDDKRKFDLSTPKRGSSAYHRILEVVPSMDKVFESMLIVKFALGIHCQEWGAKIMESDISRSTRSEVVVADTGRRPSTAMMMLSCTSTLRLL